MTEYSSKQSSPESAPGKKNFRLQFALRTLLVLTLIIGSGFGWVVSERRKNFRLATDIDALKRLGCIVRFPENEPRELNFIDSLFGRSIPGTVVTVHSVRHLVQDSDLKHLEGFSHLETLLLPRTRISDYGLEHVRDLKRLKELDLSSTAISDNGLKHLRRLAQLESLHLERNNLSDDSVVHLVCLQNLKFLWVGNTNITNDGAAELQRALPKCQIFYKGLR